MRPASRVVGHTYTVLHIVTKYKFGIESGDIHIFLDNSFY